ncbi:hypothetical protein ACQP3R_12345 [Bacillus inaquosorum]|uniref:hypothetical protein n=1 Tax=Bacillus inaquosorum TaxID=483913 RepID=UPI003D0841AA
MKLLITLGPLNFQVTFLLRQKIKFANSLPTTREFDKPALLKESKKPLLRKERRFW